MGYDKITEREALKRVVTLLGLKAPGPSFPTTNHILIVVAEHLLELVQ